MPLKSRENDSGPRYVSQEAVKAGRRKKEVVEEDVDDKPGRSNSETKCLLPVSTLWIEETFYLVQRELAVFHHCVCVQGKVSS